MKMGKYSSDSGSEKRSNKNPHKNRNRRRSSSSSSTESRSVNKRKDKVEPRSGEKSKSTRSRSSSLYKSRRRSRSKEHSKYKSRHRRSRSKPKYRRSRSRSYIREYTSKSRRPSSSSSSSENLKSVKNEPGEVKLELQVKLPEMGKVDQKLLNELNDDSFTPKTFKSKKMENIVIDLKKQTIIVPEVEPLEQDSIFHHTLFLSEEARMEKWVRELYGYRQRALQQGSKNSDK